MEVVTPQMATDYVRGNAELLDTLGIAASDAASIEVVPLKQGEHNANFSFAHPATGERFVLRVNYASQLGLDDQIGYEFRALQYLEPSGCTPRSRYVDPSKDFEGHGVLVMDFYEGEWMDYENPRHLAYAARMAAAVHSVPVRKDCPLQRPSDPLRTQLDECWGHFEVYRSSALADEAAVKRIEGFFAQAEKLVAAPFDPADATHILNTELVQSHFLIDDSATNDGCPCGHLVDWEKPIVGEVAQDVAYFLSPTTTIWDMDFIFTREQREAFLAEYWQAVGGRIDDAGFWRRFPAYVASNALRGITWSAHAWVDYHGDDILLKNQKTFERLQIYLSEWFLDRVEDICFPQ